MRVGARCLDWQPHNNHLERERSLPLRKWEYYEQKKWETDSGQTRTADMYHNHQDRVMERREHFPIPLSCSGQKMCINKQVGELNFLLVHVDDLFSLVLEILLACRKDPVFNPTSDLSSLSLMSSTSQSVVRDRLRWVKKVTHLPPLVSCLRLLLILTVALHLVPWGFLIPTADMS